MADNNRRLGLRAFVTKQRRSGVRLLLAAAVILTACSGNAVSELSEAPAISSEEDLRAIAVVADSEILALTEQLPSEPNMCELALESFGERVVQLNATLGLEVSDQIENVVLNYQASTVEYLVSCLSGEPDAALQEESSFHQEILTRWEESR